MRRRQRGSSDAGENSPANWKRERNELEQTVARLRADAERLDFAEKKRATLYASAGRWVFVDETVRDHSDRRGILGKTLREAIDAALKSDD